MDCLCYVSLTSGAIVIVNKNRDSVKWCKSHFHYFQIIAYGEDFHNFIKREVKISFKNLNKVVDEIKSLEPIFDSNLNFLKNTYLTLDGK